MKFNLRTEWFPVLILIVAVISAFYFYAHFPPRIVSHWNFAGQPDGYIDKFWGAFMMPLVLIGIYLLFLVIPHLDPKKDEYQKFASAFHAFRYLILSGIFLIALAADLSNDGYRLNIGHAIGWILGLMFIGMGFYTKQIRQNWFIGFRTPWTLSSENVWNKTHFVGGKLMEVFGLTLIVIPYLSKSWGIALFIFGLIAFVFGTLIYSYILFRSEQKK